MLELRKNGVTYDRDTFLHYDRHAFDTWQPRTKIPFADFQRMGVETHNLKVFRPGGYPDWLDSNAKIRAVLSVALTGSPSRQA